MIEDNALESVKSNITIDFEIPSKAEIIYEAILLEFESVPDFRSSMSVKLENSCIIINIDAHDSTSFRASINSAIKWIRLALEINDLTN